MFLNMPKLGYKQNLTIRNNGSFIAPPNAVRMEVENI